MTTQDYINEEIQRDRDARMAAMTQRWQAQQQMQSVQAQDYYNSNPPEVILLRAKVRELTDQLAGERGRCRDVAQNAIREMEDSDAVAGPLTSPRKLAEMIAAKIMEGE